MPNGTPEDLINAVIAADDLRRRSRRQSSTRAAQKSGLRHGTLERFLVEPFFNSLGLLWGQLTLLMPARWNRPFIQWINAKMSGAVIEQNPNLSQSIARVVDRVGKIRRETHEWPALLILTSHPETEGPRHWLRFEILRQGLQIADAVAEMENPGRWYPPRPKCFLAIDPFALDTVSTPVGAFYGAWMHRVYLAWDRQRSTQSWLQKHLLLRYTGYAHVAWTLLRELSNRNPVLMVLSGGLPYNSRLLYAAREFVPSLPVKRWNVRRQQAQLELMKILMQPAGDIWPADEGILSSVHRQSIREAMSRWGVAADQLDPALECLEEEFRRSVPYRVRLFRVLLARLVKKGKPLVLVGLTHSSTAPHVRISEPYELSRDSDPQEFAKAFGRIFSLS